LRAVCAAFPDSRKGHEKQGKCRKPEVRYRDVAAAIGIAEFIRRFLLHTLPDGFHRIRHYGFLANGERSANIALCRRLLDNCKPWPSVPPAEPTKNEAALSCCAACPECGSTMRRTATIPQPRCYPRPFHCDTS
jgi:hypothetical protein